MIKLHRMLLAGVVLAVATSSVKAAEVNGQLVIGVLGPITSTGTDLSSPTAVISLPTIQATQAGTGDFSAITAGTTIDPTGASIDVALAAAGFGFALSDGNGTFVADLGVIVTQNANFLNLYVEGLYSPAGVVTGDPGRASLNISLTFTPNASGTGGVYSFSGTLNAPPTPIIPEPSSIALAGIGLASAGLFGLRKRYSK
ncbi:PEP-CTERM sorting domain-containing protein [Paludisphaera soli]|uniref:PEP-CTERM sorting domain-containing protein n=1 Tax=Paludisphaera soli TaxID=2712865 RepID=UPI0013ED48AB|nr:PEP-CTERM sorting domain-containing protein [Paludisphaera soli]